MGSAVGSGFSRADVRVHGGKIDNLAGALLGHVPADRLGEQKISLRPARDRIVESLFGKTEKVAVMADG